MSGYRIDEQNKEKPMIRMLCVLAALLALSVIPAQAAQETKLLFSFEDMPQLNKFFINQWDAAAEKDTQVPLIEKNWSEANATHGKKALRASANDYLRCVENPDWSGYESLDIDIFVDAKEVVALAVCVGDEDWQKDLTFWNRHNSRYILRIGKNTISIPVSGLYRGEAGSRNNGIKHNIDTSKIVRFDLGFSCKDKDGSVYVDNLRLIKETPPEGVLAFDFGPPSQNIFPGFKPISWNTVFGQDDNKAGLKRPCASANKAKDDTFPTRLYQDFVNFDEDGNEFIAEVPNGRYDGWLVFDDCGYWGGEQAMFKMRTIFAEEKQVFSEERQHGKAEHFLAFEDVEPMPGDSVWDLYMSRMFKPVRFSIEVTDGTFNLRVKSDGINGGKVAALVLVSDKNKDAGSKWLSEVESRNRQEFEAQAMFVGPRPQDLQIPDAARNAGYWVGYPALEQQISVEDAPGAEQPSGLRFAARGQSISQTFAIRPLKDFEDAVSLTSTPLTGPGGEIPAANVDLRYVFHTTKRDYYGIAYSIKPHTIRPVEGSTLKLRKDVTRQFWITVDVPKDAKPGVYSGTVALKAGALSVSVPLSVEVLDLTLDEPNFRFGFFDCWAPNELPGLNATDARRKLLTLLRKNGMNSFTGGPNIKFSGLDENGKPKLDFAACDEFFKIAKECGFEGEVQSYGGPAMVVGLHDGYFIGNTGRKWEKDTGKPFTELLKIVWGEVKEHSEKAGWLPVAYNFCDEPRVVDTVNNLLELMKAYREAVPYVKIGGAYSVHWGDKPLDKGIQEIFKTLAWSGLNSHSQKELDMAKERGSEIYIYNQGYDRYSFGMYQFAEMRKGVKGRQQWHTLCLHGFQFFDLDGREPDINMINWGRNGIIPTLALARCREGSDDLRFAVTLWNLAEKKKESAEGKAAIEFLDSINRKIGVAQRLRPEGMMDDETFRKTCVDHIKKLQAAK
jgi:hypothetical protein